MRYKCDGKNVDMEELRNILEDPFLEEIGEGTQEIKGHIIVAKRD